ncbi:MAG TPA: hypothetical protein QF730_09470 [Planctomycetota bacterium]|nr:hypothetical protein [Planctomycetota bacterium]
MTVEASGVVCRIRRIREGALDDADGFMVMSVAAQHMGATARVAARSSVERSMERR